MYPCIYTKDKKKKLKTWLEGFYKYINNKLSVYDSDKKLVCTKVTKLDNEIDTFKYLVYIEDLNGREENKSTIEIEEDDTNNEEDKNKEEDRIKEEDIVDTYKIKRTKKQILDLFNKK